MHRQFKEDLSVRQQPWKKIFTHQQPYKDIFVLYSLYLRILLILCSLSRSSPSLSELVLIKFSFLIFFVKIFSSELIVLDISHVDSEKKNFTFVDHILRLSPYWLGEVPCSLKHEFKNANFYEGLFRFITYKYFDYG